MYKNRKSLRLKNYDYSRTGLYFITICANHRLSLFGKIDNDIMLLNDAGRMIEKWYFELGNKFDNIQCHQMVVMPNHFHCIIEIVDNQNRTISDDHTTVGADLCVCPHVDNKTISNHQNTGRHAGLPLRGVDNKTISDHHNTGKQIEGKNIKGRHTGLPLHEVLQWFKTMTTNEYIRGVKNNAWQPFDKKMWQRNYYEHIIRNEESYLKLLEYITSNPQKWGIDTLNPDNIEADNAK